jgi:hypothetical protein
VRLPFRHTGNYLIIGSLEAVCHGLRLAVYPGLGPRRQYPCKLFERLKPATGSEEKLVE